MITVTEAKNIIKENTAQLPASQVPLSKAAGRILAADIVAAIDFPPFHQSSMDGYAFCYNDWRQNPQLLIGGVIAAGNPDKTELTPGTAVRIFTGAPLPSGADTVVMQEKVSVEGDRLIIHDEALQPGGNVRLKGTEMQTGDPALPKGTVLTPAAIGFLAGLGITQVEVTADPKVTVIITGNELQKPGEKLEHGQVYESASFSLTAALTPLTHEMINVRYSTDELDKLVVTLQQALLDSDIIILTGGISVGDYDFVLRAAEQCGVQTLFHKIKQRPGKPLFFGRKDNRLVFGLPGNPSSVLTCYYEYVLEAAERLTGRPLTLKITRTVLKNPVNKKAGLTHFLKGWYSGNDVTVLDAQESFRMSSFARANCLIVLDEAIADCAAGTAVEIHLLPI